eukprot:jgi/Hompol1/6043/HPOL_004815-RA
MALVSTAPSRNDTIAGADMIPGFNSDIVQLHSNPVAATASSADATDSGNSIAINTNGSGNGNGGTSMSRPHSPSAVAIFQPDTNGNAVLVEDSGLFDLSRYRLPNLLENKLRRVAMREQRLRNPKLPATRIVIANFSRPQIRKAVKAVVATHVKTKERRKTKGKGKRRPQYGKNNPMSKAA